MAILLPVPPGRTQACPLLASWWPGCVWQYALIESVRPETLDYALGKRPSGPSTFPSLDSPGQTSSRSMSGLWTALAPGCHRAGVLHLVTHRHLPGPTGFPCQPLALHPRELAGSHGSEFSKLNRGPDPQGSAPLLPCPLSLPRLLAPQGNQTQQTAAPLTPPAVSRPLGTVPDPREEASVPPPTATPTVPALGRRGLHQTPGGLSGQGGGW